MMRFPTPRLPGPSKRRTLTVLMLLFVGSAGIRLATDTGTAIALEMQAKEAEFPNAVQQRSSPDRATLATLLQHLKAKKAELDEREQQIDARMADLAEAEENIAAQMQKLLRAEGQLRDTLALAEGASENDLNQLTSVYENMKPKEAATLFEEMNPEFAAGFIARMRADAAAGIMAGLSPSAAYSISAVMAGRHSDVPTE